MQGINAEPLTKQNFVCLEEGLHKYWNRNKAQVNFNKGLSKLYLSLT